MFLSSKLGIEKKSFGTVPKGIILTAVSNETGYVMNQLVFSVKSSRQCFIAIATLSNFIDLSAYISVSVDAQHYIKY